MADADGRRRNREIQCRFYGEPLGDRLRRLLDALQISQAELADTLGVGSSTLSQLMSAHRARIGTPQVLGRLVMLEQRVAAGEIVEVGVLLARVRATRPRLPGDTDGTFDLLRTVAGPDELARAADTLDHGFPSLAGLLRRAAAGP